MFLKKGVIKMSTLVTFKNQAEETGKCRPPFWIYKTTGISPPSKEMEEPEFPLGLSVGILSSIKKEFNYRGCPASCLKRKVEYFLEKEGIEGIVFNMSVPSSEEADVRQIIAVCNIIIISHISKNVHPDEIPELQTWGGYCFGKKLALVSADRRENCFTDLLRGSVDFFLKYPFDHGEVHKMMRMFISSIKEDCKGAFPWRAGACA